MPIATDEQVQTYVDERLRRRAEQVRALVLSMEDDKAAIDDVYAACAQPEPTWSDTRSDGPPHLLAPPDVLDYNAFLTTQIASIKADPTYDVLMMACVRPVGS